MLTEDKIRALKEHLLCDDTISQIEDYDPEKRIVTFKDGTQHQLVECWTR